MSNLVSEHDGQTRFVLSDRQKSLINHNLTSRHTESIDFLAVYEVEFPLEVLQLLCITIVCKISLDSCGETLPHTLHNSRVVLVRG